MFVNTATQLSFRAWFPEVSGGALPLPVLICPLVKDAAKPVQNWQKCSLFCYIMPSNPHGRAGSIDEQFWDELTQTR